LATAQTTVAQRFCVGAGLVEGYSAPTEGQKGWVAYAALMVRSKMPRLSAVATEFPMSADPLAFELMKLTDPLLETTDVGPLVSRAHYDRVRRFVEQGLADPALELMTGGTAVDGPGYFVPPTLFSADGGPHGPLFTEEIFGPVLVAAPFDDYDHAIALANSLSVGLTASVWTTSLHTALAASRDLQAGYLWVNWSSEHIAGASFGGVKNSGLGREESLEEIESYTQHKNVYIKF